jgi:hypothetical protein
MSNLNGLLPPSVTHSSPQNAYFARKVAPELTRPTLIAPITLQSVEAEGVLAVPAAITVPGPTHATPAYVGAVKITPGGNVAAEDGSAGIVIRAAAGETPSIPASTILEVGTDGEAPNQVLIAGPDGLSEVYNELYNQPVALQTITIVASDPDCTPTGGAEIFRCTQTAVAQAGAGTVQFNRIQVPKTGAYMMQSEIRMGNAGVTNTVVLPSTLVGGVPVWNSLALGMQEFSTVIAVPYSSVEVIGGDFQAIDTFASSSLTIKTYSQVLFLDSTKVYAITLAANSNLWNIGDAGQVKVELIAMC